MSRRSCLVLVSIVAHAFVLCAVVVVSVMATGMIPTPFDRVTFDARNAVKVADVHLAVARPVQRHAPSPAASADAPVALAPIEAPPAIAPGTNDAVPASPANDGLTIADGGGFDSTRVDLIEPPPPPAPAPVAPQRISTGVRPPTKVFNVDPLYPAPARAARIEGLVILEVIINAEGRVESARVLRSAPLLDQAAIDAVRQWRYTPTTLNGVAVPIVMTLTVNFSLTGR
jgi:periplasmic protein TonB